VIYSLKKVVLVYPPYHFKPPAWPFSRPTLVLAHLYAVLEKAGVCDLEVIDLDLEFDHCEEGISHFLARAEELVEKTKPDVIGLSCKVAQFPFSTLFSRKYKKSHPETKIVMGGWMPTLSPDSTLRLSGCDAVIRGEGDRSLPELIKQIGDKQWDIDGVSYVSQGKQQDIIHNPNSLVLTKEELDDLPLPRYDALPSLDRYQPGRVKPCFSVQASRGCSNHSCIFCWNSTKKCDTSWRARSPDRVVEEIRHLVDEYGAQVIFFTDDSFGAEEKWLKKFTSQMKTEFPFGEVHYVASMRVDSVNKDMLNDLYASGMRTIFHGIESGSQRSWEHLGKNYKPYITRQYILDLVEREVQNRISPICSFIVAFPEQTEEDLDQTTSFCEELALRGSIFSLQVLAPNEGTTLFEVEHYKDMIQSYDLYKEFNESENISAELRTVLGDKINEFIEYLPDFRLVKTTMPLDQLKRKYFLLGEICSYSGAIRRKFNVATLSGESQNSKPDITSKRKVDKVIDKLRRWFK